MAPMATATHNQTFVEKIAVGLDHAPPPFDLRGQLIGAGGANLHYIRNETGAIATLRGRGSLFVDPSIGVESPEPLHLYIEHPRIDGLQSAKQLVRNLIETLQQELVHYMQLHPPTAAAVVAAPPPPLAAVPVTSAAPLTSMPPPALGQQQQQQQRQSTVAATTQLRHMSVPPPMLAMPPPIINSSAGGHAAADTSAAITAFPPHMQFMPPPSIVPPPTAAAVTAGSVLLIDFT